MLPDRVSNPGPLTYKSGALPIALRGPAKCMIDVSFQSLLNTLSGVFDWLVGCIVVLRPR